MLYNPVLICGIAAWAASQTAKVIINLIKGSGFIPERFIGSGGMPSSHSSTVSAVSASMFRIYGGESPIFALTVIVSIIVVYDAMNVRYQSGLHGAELNRLRKELDPSEENKKKPGKDFKELLGHTPIEVLGGIALGFLVGALIPVKI